MNDRLAVAGWMNGHGCCFRLAGISSRNSKSIDGWRMEINRSIDPWKCELIHGRKHWELMTDDWWGESSLWSVKALMLTMRKGITKYHSVIHTCSSLNSKQYTYISKRVTTIQFYVIKVTYDFLLNAILTNKYTYNINMCIKMNAENVNTFKMYIGKLQVNSCPFEYMFRFFLICTHHRPQEHTRTWMSVHWCTCKPIR